MSEVGGLVNAKGFVEKGQLVKAGAALHQLYIFAPREWFDDLDSLSNYLMNFNWKDAQPTVLKLDRLISEELNNNQNNDRKLGKK